DNEDGTYTSSICEEVPSYLNPYNEKEEYEEDITNHNYKNILSNVFIHRNKRKMIFEKYDDIRILDNISWTFLLKKYIFIILYTMKHCIVFNDKEEKKDDDINLGNDKSHLINKCVIVDKIDLIDKCDKIDEYDKKHENIKDYNQGIVTKNDKKDTLSDIIINNEENTHKNLLHNNLNAKEVIINNKDKEELLYEPYFNTNDTTQISDDRLSFFNENIDVQDDKCYHINMSHNLNGEKNKKNILNNLTSLYSINLDNINLKKYKLMWLLNVNKTYLKYNEIVDLINIWNFLCKENNTYEMLNETDKMKIIMFFINIIKDSNICNEFVKSKINSNKTFSNVEQLNNAVNHILLNQNDVSNMCVNNNEIHTNKLLLFKSESMYVSTKAEENNMVSNVSNNKVINNYTDLKINQTKGQQMYIPMESKLLKETNDITNNDKNDKNGKNGKNGKNDKNDKNGKNDENDKNDKNGKNDINDINDKNDSNNNICIMKNEYLGDDRYDNKYYYLADIFGYINRIYVFYSNHKNVINDENKRSYTDKKKNNNNNNYYYYNYNYNHYNNNYNNNCCNISVELMNSFIFCPIHQNGNTTNLSKCNINIGYIEGIHNIDLFINNFDTSIYKETKLKKKFIEIKQIIHSVELNVLKNDFKQEKCYIKDVNDKKYNYNDLDGTITDIEDEESLNHTSHFISNDQICENKQNFYKDYTEKQISDIATKGSNPDSFTPVKGKEKKNEKKENNEIKKNNVKSKRKNTKTKTDKKDIKENIKIEQKVIYFTENEKLFEQVFFICEKILHFRKEINNLLCVTYERQIDRKIYNFINYSMHHIINGTVTNNTIKLIFNKYIHILYIIEKCMCSNNPCYFIKKKWITLFHKQWFDDIELIKNKIDDNMDTLNIFDILPLLNIYFNFFYIYGINIKAIYKWKTYNIEQRILSKYKEETIMWSNEVKYLEKFFMKDYNKNYEKMMARKNKKNEIEQIIKDQQKKTVYNNINDEQENVFGNIKGVQKISDVDNINDNKKLNDIVNINDNQKMSDVANINDNQKVSDVANINDNQKVSDDANINDNQKVSDDANINDNQKVSDDANINDNHKINNDANISDNQKLNDDANIIDNQKINKDANINDNQKKNDDTKNKDEEIQSEKSSTEEEDSEDEILIQKRKKMNALRKNIYEYMPFQKNEKYFYFKEGHMEHINKFKDYHTIYKKEDNMDEFASVEQLHVHDIKIYFIPKIHKANQENKNKKKKNKNDTTVEEQNMLLHTYQKEEHPLHGKIIRNNNYYDNYNNCWKCTKGHPIHNITCTKIKKKKKKNADTRKDYINNNKIEYTFQELQLTQNMKKKKKQKIKKKKNETFHIINNEMINDHIYHKLYNDIFETKNKIQNNDNMMNEKKVNIYNSKNISSHLANLTNTINLRINDNVSSIYNNVIDKDQNILQKNDINNNKNYTNQCNYNITNENHEDIYNNDNQSCLLLCQLHCTILSRQHEIADSLYKKLNLGIKNVTLQNNIKSTNIYLFNLYFDENMKTLLYIIPSKKIYKSLNSNWKVGLKCRIQKPLCATNYNAYSARIRRIIYDPQHLWKCVTVKKDTQKFNKNSINQKVNFWELTKKKNV
ncbi:conserved Plasmodium protein, unknown function, partial [Plasmodium sp. gorilla clade G3]